MAALLHNFPSLSSNAMQLSEYWYILLYFIHIVNYSNTLFILFVYIYFSIFAFHQFQMLFRVIF